MMKIVEVPDYVELNDRQVKELLSKVVQDQTGRTVHSVEIYHTGRHSDVVHCKVFLNKPAVGDDLV